MSDVTLRRAVATDVAGIVALLTADELGRGRERPGDPAYSAAFEAIDADPNQFLMVAAAGGEVVGCLQLTFIPGLSRAGMWRGQIEAVRVRGDRRGSGLGRAMFERAIKECRARSCGLVQLTTDKTRADAHHFYESLGFEASHEGMKLTLG